MDLFGKLMSLKSNLAGLIIAEVELEDEAMALKSHHGQEWN